MLVGRRTSRQKEWEALRGFPDPLAASVRGNRVSVDCGLSRLWKKLHESSIAEAISSGCRAEKYGLALRVLPIRLYRHERVLPVNLAESREVADASNSDCR
jgi:hypothetical protein